MPRRLRELPIELGGASLRLQLAAGLERRPCLGRWEPRRDPRRDVQPHGKVDQRDPPLPLAAISLPPCLASVQDIGLLAVAGGAAKAAGSRCRRVRVCPNTARSSALRRLR
jgi:hypothetical protein